MSELWVPGLSSAPQDEFVARLHRAIGRFAADAGVERAFVEIELVDGARYAVDTLTAEPGFDFVTIKPDPDEGEGFDVPEQLVVPVSSIRRIELARAEERRERFGFSLPDA